MSDLSGSGAGNLSRSPGLPLRGGGLKARQQHPPQPARVLSGEGPKNGENRDLKPEEPNAPPPAGGAKSAEELQTLRERSQGKHVWKARKAQNAQLTAEERIQKLGRIRKSAVEYEAVFVDQLVKQMRQSPLAKTPGGDTFSDLAEQPFRDYLSRAGGLGLADTIVGQVARQEGLEQTLHDYPGIMGPNWQAKIAPSRMDKPAGNLSFKPEKQDFQTAGPPAPPAAEEPESASAPGPEPVAGLMSAAEIARLYREPR
ncbi:MAG: hypothetical protein LBP33_11675 [Candidatus Adiutrix sp.]|nr:hypothetical protein [Candidatus Adiutrix sp.]